MSNKNQSNVADKTVGICLHDMFNEALIKSGQVKTIDQAKLTPRYLSCPCKKCNPSYM